MTKKKPAEEKPICSMCGGDETVKAGTKMDRQGKWQMHLCKSCGHKQKGAIIKKFKTQEAA